MNIEHFMTHENFAQFQKAMDAEFIHYDKQVKELANLMDISINCANDVLYLRTRARHTDELEQELIRLHKAGTPPNIMEFGTGKVNLLEGLFLPEQLKKTTSQTQTPE